jgi:hypothetical protein
MVVDGVESRNCTVCWERVVICVACFLYACIYLIIPIKFQAKKVWIIAMAGSDLKSLCTTVAYHRIRELLDQETKEKIKSSHDPRPLKGGSETVKLDPLESKRKKEIQSSVRKTRTVKENDALNEEDGKAFSDSNSWRR